MPRFREGERKLVTVLFADVVGSMDLTAKMNAEDWAWLMTRFFAILRQGLNRFGGRIDKFTGDGVMALFGAPLAYEDHAQRACAAAIYLLEEVSRFADELREERSIVFASRIGINSGEVIVGNIGEDLAIEYTALGSTVGLAQRMEALAEPGTANLTAATAALVQDYFELEPLGSVKVKSSDPAVEAFRLVSRATLSTRIEVAAARGFSRFVGREQEVALLDRKLVEASDGNGQIVGLIADAGVGKSRLCHEFALVCDASGTDVFRAHGRAHVSVSYEPLLDILRAQFGIGERDDLEESRSKMAEDVRVLDESVNDELPLLYEFLDIASAEAAPQANIDAEARQRRIFAALVRLQRARCERRPSVLLLEDLHWLDSGTEAFLKNLVAALRGMRLLVVTTFRPEYQAPWTDDSSYSEVQLGPLDEEAGDELVRDLLGPHPALDSFAALVLDRTGGNPFFMEEVVQDFVEEGSLKGRRGAYEPTTTITSARIPATVEAVLSARIDRLHEREKTLLQTAAVIGAQFTGPLIGRVSGMPDNEWKASLRKLAESEFIYDLDVRAEDGFAFKHALTEEVAYQSLLTTRRTRVHATVAEALTEIDADRLDERAGIIAHHHEMSEDLLEAARWNARAATFAGFSHPAEAARRWRRIREFTGRLDPSPESGELGMNARMMLFQFHWRLGAASEEGHIRFEDESAEVFGEAIAIAEAIDQPALKAAVLSTYGASKLGDKVEEGIDLSRQATAIVDELGEPNLRTVARAGLSWGTFVLGDVREAASVAEEMINIMGDDRSIGRGVVIGSPYGWSRMQLAFFRAHFDRLDQGLVEIERATALLGEEGDDESRSWGQRAWAICADLAEVDPDAAAAHANEALEWAEDAGGQWSRIFNRGGVAISHAQREEWEEAIAVVDEALSIQRERRIALSDVPLLLSVRARAQLGDGDVDGAKSSADEAIAIALHCSTKGYEAIARLQLARVLLAGDPSNERSRAELNAALALFESLGLRAYIPQVHVELARLARATGDDAVAAHVLNEAREVFMDMGAVGRAAQIDQME